MPIFDQPGTLHPLNQVTRLSGEEQPWSATPDSQQWSPPEASSIVHHRCCPCPNNYIHRTRTVLNRLPDSVWVGFHTSTWKTPAVTVPRGRRQVCPPNDSAPVPRHTTGSVHFILFLHTPKATSTCQTHTHPRNGAVHFKYPRCLSEAALLSPCFREGNGGLEKRLAQHAAATGRQLGMTPGLLDPGCPSPPGFQISSHLLSYL